MAHTFFPHQQLMYEYATGKSRMALFCEMRLGKSVVAIRWVKQLPEHAARILLLTPLSAVADWCTELAAEGQWFLDLTGESRADRVAMAAVKSPYVSQGRFRTWYILNYESLRATDEFHDPERWDVIIADESSLIRNPKAKITKVMTRAFQSVRYRAALTGTPNPESPLDYFSQMQFLYGEFVGFHNFWSFRQVLFRQIGYDWQPKAMTRMRINHDLKQKSFQMTRKQANIGPQKLYQRRVLEPTPEITAGMKQIKREFKFENLETQWATQQHIWLARLAGGFSPDRDNPKLLNDAKLREIMALMDTDLRGESVIIWFYFLEELNAAVDWIRPTHTVEAIHGGISKDERFAIRERFAAGTTQILCLQIKTGRFGMNLARADTAIYYSNSWSLEERQQSEDRILHLEKKNPLLLIDLITRGSTDEAVVNTLREKNMNAAQFRSKLLDNLQKQFGQAVHDADRDVTPWRIADSESRVTMHRPGDAHLE